jgi:hypothetical protein
MYLDIIYVQMYRKIDVLKKVKTIYNLEWREYILTHMGLQGLRWKFCSLIPPISTIYMDWDGLNYSQIKP